MNMVRRMRGTTAREEGSALVAAVGVSMIGLLLSIVVMTTAIMATQNSARDRVRTVEVHAAESQLDLALRALESGNPCTVADTVIGSGTTATTVHVTYEYTDANGALLTTCVNGKISGTPVEAKVTAVATQVNPVAGGGAPKRTIEADVLITPVQVATAGSAIFSGGAFSTGAGFQVSSVDLNQRARIWIDSGNWTCNTSVTLTGDLVVAQGSASLQNATCQITGNVWAKTGFTSCCTPSATYSVGGDLTVYAGNFTLSNKNRFGGDISVGGNITTGTHWNATTVAGTVCSNNVGGACTGLTNYAPMGFPQIDYKPGDWSGFAVKTKSDFTTVIKNSWAGLSMPQWYIDSITNMNCNIPISSKNPKTASAPINLPSTKTIYDLRGCVLGNSGGTALFKLYADTVIFAKGFSSSNGMVFQSGDGQVHTVYLIVPVGQVAGTPAGYVSGDIGFSTGLQVVEPASIFLYTPKNLSFPNTSTTRGQVYGGTVTVGQGSGVFKFFPVPLPGGYLSTATTAPAGSTVEVVSKNET